MYLHIGQDWMLPYDDIIAIFQRRMLDISPEFRQLFSRLRSEGRVFGDGDEAKSIILTDHTLLFTSISCHTLLRRAEHPDLPFE